MTIVPPSPKAAALVLAPQGRDAVIASGILGEIGIRCRVCSNVAELEQELNDNVSFVVVSEEALRGADLRGIVEHIRLQPPWSDLSFIILTRRDGNGHLNSGGAELTSSLGNVALLERPFRPTTFKSVAHTAYKARLRQFEARARIEELREGEERLRTALLAGRLGSWELDVTTSTLTTTPTCRALFGRAVDDPFTYDDLFASIHPDDQQRMKETVQASIEHGTDYSIEYRNIWPDGSIHWAEIRARVVLDRAGLNPRLVGVSSDITDRKSAEQSLKHLNETLEQRVLDRSEKLIRAEEALHQARKMEAVGQLTGGIAHDFNNLLAGISGSLELMSRRIAQGRSTEIDKYMSAAQGAANRAAGLTHRLLAFSRRQTLEPKATDVNALALGMLDLVRRTVGPSIAVEFVTSTEICGALVDPSQLENALLNLCINSRDAMPDGGKITIETAFREVDQLEAEMLDTTEGAYLVLSVTDEGCGMSPETIARAFEPFFTTKPMGQGTGLGLSMIYGFAKQSGGQVRIDSKIGKGTRISIFLPKHHGETYVNETALDALLEPIAVSGQTVLVVDDEPTVRLMVTDVLTELGYKVLEATDGAGGLSLLQSDARIDLLITDVGLPGGMNGRQMADAARLHRESLKVLFITGFAETALFNKGKLDTSASTLAKPFTVDALAVRIRDMIEH